MGDVAHSLRAGLALAFDRAAEVTVAPSFSRVGIEIRRRLEAWDDPPSTAGRVALVTGATSGIGLAAAIGLGRRGMEVHLVGRDPVRGESALKAVRQAGSAGAELHLVDLGDPESTTALGHKLVNSLPRLDAVVHNAGALFRTFQTTDGGVERTLAIHVLSPYVLTAALLPLLRSPSHHGETVGNPTIIVTVSSGGMYSQRFDLGTLEARADGYNGAVAYAKAKRAQVVLAEGWAQLLAPCGVVSYSMHPGWVDTPGLTEGLPRFRRLIRPLLRTPEEGADTIVWLAAGGLAEQAQAESTGVADSGFFLDRHLRSDHRFPISHPTRPGDPERLLTWCGVRTGIDVPEARSR